jgi:hypothetical protein
MNRRNIHTRRRTVLAWAVLLLTAGVCLAQFRGGGWGGSFIRIEGGQVIDEDTVRTARETAPHSMETPTWTNAPGFGADVFTFARVIFRSNPNARARVGWSRRLGWWVDYPDADLNLSWRLQHLTAIRTDPDARVLRLTDPDLFDFPLLYMEHAGYMVLSDAEVEALRRYLLNGGALFVNDFWSTEEWEGFEREMQRVLPGREWTELTMDHPVFHCVYRLEGPMNRLQVPTMQFWNPHHDPSVPSSRLQRIYRGEGSEDMHVRAWFDDRRRPMILVIHNSDISDGWEREGENDRYFHLYSEKVAYPLTINILFYLMTH